MLTVMSEAVTVVLLTWNALEYTRRCLQSLRAVATDAELRIVVVDNGSRDQTLAYLAGLDGITVVANAENLGFAKGVNAGLAAAPEGDVVLLNNDVVIDSPGWVDRLRATAHGAPDIGIVVCRLTGADGRLQHAGTFMPRSTFRGEQIGGGEVDVGQHALVHEVDGGVAAVMYLRRDCLDDVRGMDPTYFSYFEDTDLCLRAQGAGWRVMYDGTVSLLHHGNVSTRENHVQLSEMFEESRATFMARWAAHYRARRAGAVAWRSSYFWPPGYASATRGLVGALDARGVDVLARPLDPPEARTPGRPGDRVDEVLRRPQLGPDPQVEVSFAPAFRFRSEPGTTNVGYTMLEVDGLPRDWVDAANAMDEVWVPSAFNQQTFAASGVRRPIRVVPLGYDPSYFNPGIAAFRHTGRFTFLSVFEWGERKAPETLLRAFSEEFGGDEDVLLVVKTANADPEVDIRRQVAALGLRRGRAPIAIDVNRPIPAHQMGALYRSANAFVFPTRGEGWGLPVMEALACGLPTIATPWSGLTEFFDAEVGFPIDYTLVPARAKGPYYRGHRWAEPDLGSLRVQLRAVYEQAAEAARRGAAGARRMRERYGLEQVAAQVARRLAELEAEGSPRPVTTSSRVAADESQE